MSPFVLVDKYMYSRLGILEEECKRGILNIIESDRRTKKEMSYGYLHFLWWVEFADGTTIISVPPKCKEPVEDFLAKRSSSEITDKQFGIELKEFVDGLAQKRFGKEISTCFRDVMFACCNQTFKSAGTGVETVQIIDGSIPAAQGIVLPQHCMPDGIAYGAVVENRIVSTAYAHRTGEYENVVADIGVETAPEYRKQGYGKAVVSAVTKHMLMNAGEALYKCDPANIASRATAQSVGFVPYGKSLILAIKGEL